MEEKVSILKEVLQQVILIVDQMKLNCMIANFT